MSDELETARVALLEHAAQVFGSPRAAEIFFRHGVFFEAGELTGKTVPEVGGSIEGLRLLWRYVDELGKGQLAPILLSDRDTTAFKKTPYLQVLGGTLCQVDATIAVRVSGEG